VKVRLPIRRRVKGPNLGFDFLEFPLLDVFTERGLKDRTIKVRRRRSSRDGSATSLLV